MRDDVVSVTKPVNIRFLPAKDPKLVPAGSSPTDIFVVGGQPHHFVDKDLHAHHESHTIDPTSILRLSHQAVEQAEWSAEESFMVEFTPDGTNPSAPYPFAEPVLQATFDDGKYRARSGAPRLAAVGNHYKAVFTFVDHGKVDPDLVIDP